jgi:hypothetical protein
LRPGLFVAARWPLEQWSSSAAWPTTQTCLLRSLRGWLPWNLVFVRVPHRQCTGRLVAASTFCRPWASTESSAFDGRPTWRRDRSAMLSTPATGSFAAIRRAVFSETPLSVAISLHVCSAQYLNLVSFEHLDHPFPSRKPNLQRFSDPVVLPAGGQNFRKGSGQNTRNPQRAADSASRRALGSPRPTSSDVFALSTGGPTSETAHDARLKRSSSLSATPRCGSHWRPTAKPASSFTTGEGCPL